MKPSQKRKKRARAQSREPWGEWGRCHALKIEGPNGTVEKYDETWRNNRYQVSIRRFPCEAFKDDDGTPLTMAYVTIKRNDKESIHDWRDLQRIKNELLGPEVEAVELYPAESRLVDTSNQYHLWALPEGVPWPFGFFDSRLVSSPESAEEVGAKQRPFEDPPDDLDAKQEEVREQYRQLKTS
jgi:hypothetical protein